MTNAREMERARKHLLEDYRLTPGDTIYTKLCHRSRSGMYRVIDLYIIRNNEPLRITYTAALLLDGYDRRHEGARARGCGMDMGFALVYDLSRRLWPDGYECTGEGCTSNDHSNRVDRLHHPDGGYALRQQWL